MSTFQPRPAQSRVLAYRQGTLGIAAVPGSGKTWTLSRLAASIILEDRFDPDQEILIVTLVNSAVDNFKKRIASFLKEEGYIPNLGYRVSTLHSLAYDIVAQAPHYVGLGDVFFVVDERQSTALKQASFQANYTRYEEEIARSYFIESLNDYKRKSIQRKQLPAELEQVTSNAISHLKNKRIPPAAVKEIPHTDDTLLARLAIDVYRGYEQGLKAQGAMDFDDLITHALDVLDADPDLLERHQQKWPLILEDEAQDSSKLQEGIIRKLAGQEMNWVRVGDPNQAIYETFTTANPAFLRQFLVEADVRQDLPASGRSGKPIIHLANHLIEWTKSEHPVTGVRTALDYPLIQPTEAGDPQPNPPEEACQVVFHYAGETPDKELDNLVRSLKNWLTEHPDATVAVLVPTHGRGADVVNALEQHKINYTDALLRLTRSTRQAAGALGYILQFLAHPEDVRPLISLFKVWYYRVQKIEKTEASEAYIKEMVGLLQQCEKLESYLWPIPGADWLEVIQESLKLDQIEDLTAFRLQLQRWQERVMLPISELLTSLAQDVFDEPEKLSMTQLFGELLARDAEFKVGTDDRIATLVDMERGLKDIAKDQRKLRSLEADKTGFDPENHRGVVAVATMHGAKGLEWDRVYLLSVNDYDFPAGLPDDTFRSEKWFVRDSLSLADETMGQLDSLVEDTAYVEGQATHEARLEYARERLRLLFVGITRARKELIVTSNKGKFDKNKPALAFEILKQYLEEQNARA